jgi:hypothetical protein
MTNMNLDLEAAKVAQEIVKEASNSAEKDKVEKLVMSSLSVLHENGVFACMLYLYSRNQTTNVTMLKGKLVDTIKLLGKSPPSDREADSVLKFLTDNVCNDLDTLLLTKKLWEQTLVYAKYGIAARS